MDELKLVFASNLIRLRTNAGLTQTELGEKLNYSDKSISKWERGETVPDAAVLKRMGDIFGVSVDELLSEQIGWEPAPEKPEKQKKSVRAGFIVMVALASIATAAVIAFVVLWLVLEKPVWLVFTCSLPAALTIWLILDCTFVHSHRSELIVAGLVFSIILLIYSIFATLGNNFWQLFLISIPAEGVVYAAYRINHKEPKRIRDRVRQGREAKKAEEASEEQDSTIEN